MNDSMNPIPDNAVLIIADVQNGFLNENTDYLPGAINDFITRLLWECPCFLSMRVKSPTCLQLIT